MTAVAARVQAFDWLRGLAVLFMIQCHALALLKPEIHAEPLFKWLVRLDGLVAPAFTFSAGFSLALVQVRSAAGEGSRVSRTVKTLRRIGEVLLVAILVNWAWFPIFREPRWIGRLDILHCIGLSLLLALPLLVALAKRPKVLRWVALAGAAVVFGVSPLLEKDAWAFDWLLNSTTGAAFPILPWAGYVFLGASLGATAGLGDFWKLIRWVAFIGAIGAAMWLADGWFKAAYPPHNFWVTNPANAAQRWTVLMGVLLVLLFVEARVGEKFRKSPPVFFVTAFGSSSLAAYFFHEMLLYYRVFGFSFHAWWGKACDWPKYWALTALLIAMTFVLVLITDRVYRRLRL